MPNRRLQSAIEYLTTYGWALLIIAVVLAVLFELGIFSPYTLATKAQPGGCQVYRPYGPNTTQGLTLQGLCNNLIPLTVARLNGANKANITTKTPFVYNAVNNFTVAMWVNPMPSNANSILVGETPTEVIIAPQTSYTTFFIGGNGHLVVTCVSTTGEVNFTNNAWQQVVVVSGTASSLPVIKVYVNDQLESVSSAAGCGGANLPLVIGSADGAGNFFNGSISNVQIYNASLSTSEISVLYSEGIGGVPLRLQNLVVWWPLNGNDNDYSGRHQNAIIYNSIFQGGWYSGYTAP